MSFLVFSGSIPFAQAHPRYTEWKNSCQDVTTCYGLEEVPDKSTGLFFDAPGVVILTDYIKAGDLRQLFYRAEETGENMCVISEKKPRGNFDKDGIDIIDLSYPSAPKKRAELLSSVSGITHKQAIKIAQIHDDPLKAYIVSQQANFVESMPSWSQFYIPEDKDNPPWLITNAINDGKTSQALKQVQILARKKKTTPQSLAMQVTGYYTKVITEDSGFFAKIKKSYLGDLPGMVADMSFYPAAIMSAGKTGAQHTLYAYIASLSSRFK